MLRITNQVHSQILIVDDDTVLLDRYVENLSDRFQVLIDNCVTNSRDVFNLHYQVPAWTNVKD